MAQWYVKDLSKLTDISVQTLHHYDRIGLLKPSVRLMNGYRLYSEKDLLTLQQIIALKFFGFELLQIKTLLMGKTNVLENFSVQAQFLEEKAKTLFDASQTLKSIISEIKDHQSIPWEIIIKTIEVYRMTQQLEHAWIGNILNPEELKEYATVEQNLKTRYTQAQKKDFEQGWENLVKQIEANLDKDPTSEFGRQLGKQCMDRVNTVYGTKHAALRTSIWERGYKQSQLSHEHGLSPEVVTWLDQAVSAYYRYRLYAILDQVGTTASDAVLKQWEETLEEMHGNDKARDKAVYDMALQDDHVSQAAKNWLKTLKPS